ncbi:MAG TPA: hypothetical protein VEW47_17440 [Candidatus Dormibacteraeota bacterium]|nr:hypothetical protein [Candidatus Dormibacteraeota bacterium]
MRLATRSAIWIVVAATTQGAIDVSPFHVQHWFADGIAVGEVVSVAERTVDFKIEQWFRDRTQAAPHNIRVFRYTESSCTPRNPESYSPGTRYLVLIRKPHDAGAGNNEYWIVIWQALLDGSGFCLDGPVPFPIAAAGGHCQKTVSAATFLDALQSFDSCFTLHDDPMTGSVPSAQMCSDEVLKDWSARSPLHSILARQALEQIQKAAHRDGV